jgi:hypothetical protein
VKLVVIRSVWDCIEKPEAFRKWLSTVNDCVPVVLNNPEFILWNMNKMYLKQLHEFYGIKIIPSLFLNSDIHCGRLARSCRLHLHYSFIHTIVV